MGCFMAPPLLRCRLLPFPLFYVFFFFFFKFNRKYGTVRIVLITVLRTVRSDRGSDGSLFFAHITVLEAKRTVKMNDSRFFQSDRTVRSVFHNLAYIIDPTKMFQTFRFFFGSTTTTLTENKKSKVKTLIVAPYKKQQSLFTTSPPRKYFYKIANILFYTNKNRPSIINVIIIIFHFTF